MSCQHDPFKPDPTVSAVPTMRGTLIGCASCGSALELDADGCPVSLSILVPAAPPWDTIFHAPPPPAFYECGEGYAHPVGTACTGQCVNHG